MFLSPAQDSFLSATWSATLNGLGGCLPDLTEDSRSYISGFCFVKDRLKTIQQSVLQSSQKQPPSSESHTAGAGGLGLEAALSLPLSQHMSSRVCLLPSCLHACLPATLATAGAPSPLCQLPSITGQEIFQKPAVILLHVPAAAIKTFVRGTKLAEFLDEFLLMSMS